MGARSSLPERPAVCQCVIDGGPDMLVGMLVHLATAPKPCVESPSVGSYALKAGCQDEAESGASDLVVPKPLIFQRQASRTATILPRSGSSRRAARTDGGSRGNDRSGSGKLLVVPVVYSLLDEAGQRLLRLLKIRQPVCLPFATALDARREQPTASSPSLAPHQADRFVSP